MVWICAGNSVDNTGMFLLLLTGAYTASRPFLLLTPPHQWVGWGGTSSWEGTQPGQLTPTDPRHIPDHMTSCSAYRAGGRRRKRWTCSEWWRLSSQVTEQSSVMMEPALTSAYYNPALHTILQTLGYTFSKSHLVSQHQRICPLG